MSRRDRTARAQPPHDDPAWMAELSAEERKLVRDPAAVDVDGDQALRWLETGEGRDPWAPVT